MSEPPTHRLPDLNDRQPMEEIELEALTTPQLISLLKAPSQNSNLEKIEQTLISRDYNFLETLTQKEVDMIEMVSRCDDLSKKCSAYEEKLVQNQKEIDSYKVSVEKLKAEVNDLQISLMAEKTMNEELRAMVLNLEREKRGKYEEKGPVFEISDDEDVKEKDARAYVEDVEKDEYFLLTPTPKKRRISRVVMSDSENDDVDVGKGKEPICDLGGCMLNRDVNGTREAIEKEEVDILADKDVNFEKNLLSASTPKRRRGFRVDDDDDDIPISSLRAKRLKKKKEEIKEANKKDENVLEADDVTGENNFMSSCTPKRKCSLRVMDDDDDGGGGGVDDDDDYVPISNLIARRRLGDNNGKCHDEATSSRRRLVRLGEHSIMKDGEKITSTEVSTVQNNLHSKTDGMSLRTRSAARQRLKFIDTGGPNEDDDSGSEGDSLSGFIVSGSDSQGCESSSHEVSSSYSSEGSSSDVDLDDVLARIHSDKGNREWKYEADMLSSLGKDPELCMKAVCALYRQQTSEEQSIKGAIVQNNRGFNQPDAYKGSMVAEFLLEGDVDGSVKKTVQELEERFPKGLDYCRKIAFRYSKQLFSIYMQKEDPYFHP